ncbi:MAG: hypothetical protein V4638_09715 [Bacteroidota bacterium]
MRFLQSILLTFAVLVQFFSIAQVSSARKKTLEDFKVGDTLQLDSLSIYPNSFSLFCGDELLTKDQYQLLHSEGKIIISNECRGALQATFRVLPMNLSTAYSKRDTSMIFNEQKGSQDKFLITENYDVNDVFGGTSLSKNGSVSRGITFGNNQNLGVNSTLNLELSGEIAPNLKLIASLSDDNLPIQPDGNTNKLQEFDQVFIQLYNDRFKIVAGDFWLYRPKGYFLNYRKRAQGLTVDYRWTDDTLKVWKTQVSGALSKGKFNRQIIPGIEGNQGPYRLRGNENEPFITILAGTERVFIDGRLLERGQAFDYTINYNSAELIFTSRNLITKDVRIVVEFQYSDLSYARSLLQTSTTYSSNKIDFWFNAYSEQDAKNQTIQQDLTGPQKLLLGEIGDSLYLANINSIDSVGFLENQVLYKLIDSLGYDSVLVFSVHPDSAFYQAVFTFVGAGKGNYVFNNLNALGKVYKWVQPIFGVPQGDFEPTRLIVTPKQKQMVSSGVMVRFNKNLSLESELAYTGNDINTFSKKDARDNSGFSGRSKLIGLIPLAKDSAKWELETKAEVEFLSANFSPIEQYRAVEFDRDWNTRNKGYLGYQLGATAGTNFKNSKFGNINVEGQHFRIGEQFQGTRAATNGSWNQKGFSAIWDGSYLSSASTQKSNFVRHRIDVSQKIGKILRIGYKDDHELNTFSDQAVALSKNSYQFFDYQFYLSNGDSVKTQFKLFYRERYDKISDSTVLRKAAKGQTAGAELKLTQFSNQTLNIITAYRKLSISDSTLIQLAPENSILGRVDYDVRLFKNALTFSTFYEIGSGLEQKRSFQYIQVNDGQGIYTWIDYNADGVKDLNEFEVAQFVDQASYIRVFTPSNEYTKTYSNELNQTIFWRPERIWATKKGFLKVLSMFSDQARVRIYRKTSIFDGIEAFNPFSNEVRDSSLISATSNIRNTLFFNRTSSVFSAEYSYQILTNKNLLATGFDSKSNYYNELSLRLNIKKIFTIENVAQIGNKLSIADYTSGRNFQIDYYFIQPKFIIQPTTTFRVSLEGRFSNKQNSPEFGNEKAVLYDLGTNLKYNQTQKGSLQASFKWVQIKYNGSEFSALGYEMLESLRNGTNFTWNITYQRSVSKNLQLNLQYNGRKSENSKMIHSGGMELRAFF